MKLEIHLQKEKWKNKHWRLKKYANKILMGHCKKKKEEIIKYFEKNETHTHTHTHTHTNFQNLYRMQQKQIKEESL